MQLGRRNKEGRKCKLAGYARTSHADSRGDVDIAGRSHLSIDLLTPKVAVAVAVAERSGHLAGWLEKKPDGLLVAICVDNLC